MRESAWLLQKVGQTQSSRSVPHLQCESTTHFCYSCHVRAARTQPSVHVERIQRVRSTSDDAETTILKTWPMQAGSPAGLSRQLRGVCAPIFSTAPEESAQAFCAATKPHAYIAAMLFTDKELCPNGARQLCAVPSLLANSIPTHTVLDTGGAA